MDHQVDVLLVDDDKDICVMVEAILTFAGFKVQACTIPQQLASLIGSTRPRLLLMDMLLSGTDGRDICRHLRSDPATRQLKIMMMSAHPDASKSCHEAGANDFIAKPFDMDEFIQKIRHQLTSV